MWEVYKELRSSIHKEYKESFSSQNSLVEGILSQSIISNINTCELGAEIFSIYPHLGSEEFEDIGKETNEYISHLLRYEWIPVIEHNDRDGYEIKAANIWNDYLNLTDNKFPITNYFTGNASENASVYYPLQYIYPVENNEGLINVNFADFPNVVNEFKRANKTGETQISDVVGLYSPTGELIPGLVSISPSFISNEIYGYILGILPIATILDYSLRNIEATHLSFYMFDTKNLINLSKLEFVYGITIEGNGEFTYWNTIDSLGFDNGTDFYIYQTGPGKDSEFIYSEIFNIKNKQYILLAVTEEGYTNGIYSQTTNILIIISVINFILIVSCIVILYILRYQYALSQQHQDALTHARSYMLAFVCHEIRNPLHGIISIIESLGHENKIEEYMVDDMKSIELSSLTMLNLVNDVLDVDKLQRGGELLVLSNQPVDIKDLFKNLCQQYGRLADVPIKYHIDKKIPDVIVSDQRRIEQVITNGLTNAIKYTSKGYIQLNALVISHPYTNKWMILFEVKDTGGGLHGADPKELFKEFKMSTTRKNKDGSGLGLSIAKRIVRVAKGEIGLTEDSDGCKFWFTIPLKIPRLRKKKKMDEKKTKDINGTNENSPQYTPESVANEMHHHHTLEDIEQKINQKIYGPLTISTKSSSSLKMKPYSVGSYDTSASSNENNNHDQQQLNTVSKKIWTIDDIEFEKLKFYLIDDENINRRILKRMLSQLNVPNDNLTEFADGQDLLSIRDEFFNTADLHETIILMDILMKHSRGDDICAELRSQGWGGVMIAATGNAESDQIKSYLEKGFDAVLTKPFRRDELKNALNKCLIRQWNSSSSNNIENDEKV